MMLPSLPSTSSAADERQVSSLRGGGLLIKSLFAVDFNPKTPKGVANK